MFLISCTDKSSKFTKKSKSLHLFVYNKKEQLNIQNEIWKPIQVYHAFVQSQRKKKQLMSKMNLASFNRSIYLAI